MSYTAVCRCWGPAVALNLFYAIICTSTGICRIAGSLLCAVHCPSDHHSVVCGFLWFFEPESRGAVFAILSPPAWIVFASQEEQFPCVYATRRRLARQHTPFLLSADVTHFLLTTVTVDDRLTNTSGWIDC